MTKNINNLKTISLSLSTFENLKSSIDGSIAEVTRVADATTKTSVTYQALAQLNCSMMLLLQAAEGSSSEEVPVAPIAEANSDDTEALAATRVQPTMSAKTRQEIKNARQRVRRRAISETFGTPAGRKAPTKLKDRKSQTAAKSVNVDGLVTISDAIRDLKLTPRSSVYRAAKRCASRTKVNHLVYVNSTELVKEISHAA